MQKTGSEIILESLAAEGVNTIFGYPGGAVLPLYDTLPKYAKKIRHILTRHEQGAAFAAAGYARASGKTGVCLATSGPGATNLITGIADAHLDSIPVVAITGQVASGLLGTDAFQEADVTGITLPITKHNSLVTKSDGIAQSLKEAFYLARSGRPGPVHVDITKDAQIEKSEFDYSATAIDLPGYLVRGPASAKQVDHAAKFFEKKSKPVVIVGAGAVRSGATKEVKELAKKIDAAIVSTLHGVTAVPHDTPGYLGMLGMHGLAAANYAIAHADLVVAVGIRFDDRITGKLDEFAREAAVVHIDIDAAEIDKNVRADAPIVADAKQGLAKLLPKIKKSKNPDWLEEITAYEKSVTEKLKKVSAKKDTKKSKLLRAVEVVHTINAVSPDAFIVSDVGQNQMWAAMHFKFQKPGRYLSSGGLGTMGFGLPTAMGAQVAKPKDTVWCLTGDGGLQMNSQELTTLAAEKIPVKIAVMNNSYLGMIRQWQELFYGKNYSQCPIVSPDFVQLAKSCGVKAWRVKNPKDAKKIAQKALDHPGPALVDFTIEAEENVFPMVPPGQALSETRIA